MIGKEKQESGDTLLLLEHSNSNQVDRLMSTLSSPEIKLLPCNSSSIVANVNIQTEQQISHKYKQRDNIIGEYHAAKQKPHLAIL